MPDLVPLTLTHTHTSHAHLYASNYNALKCWMEMPKCVQNSNFIWNSKTIRKNEMLMKPNYRTEAEEEMMKRMSTETFSRMDAQWEGTNHNAPIPVEKKKNWKWKDSRKNSVRRCRHGKFHISYANSFIACRAAVSDVPCCRSNFQYITHCRRNLCFCVTSVHCTHPPNERKGIEYKGIEFQRKQSLCRMLELETNRW